MKKQLTQLIGIILLAVLIGFVITSISGTGITHIPSPPPDSAPTQATR